MHDKVDILTFAKDKEFMNKHLFDYEEKQLLNYSEWQESSTYYEWIKPSRRENQRTYDIWLTYQEYLEA